MFEKATRLKLRFNVSKGTITTEDVWDLNLIALDNLAKSLNKEIKESSEESFIKARTQANETLDLKFEIVKHIIGVKLAEQEAKKQEIEKAQKRALLKDLINKKELNSLEEKSLDDLKKELEELEK